MIVTTGGESLDERASRENTNRDGNGTEKGPRLPGNAHKRKGGIGPQLPVFQQGKAWVFIEYKFVVIHCTLPREKGERGKRSRSPKRVCPAGNRARSVVCEGSPVSR